MLEEGIIISSFISKIVNDLTDISIIKIKEAVKNRKYKHQNIESQIYNVIVNVLTRFLDLDRDDDFDEICDLAEQILKSMKNCESNIDDIVKSCFKVNFALFDNNKCEEFVKLCYHEISSTGFEELYKEIKLLNDKRESEKASRIERKVDELLQSVNVINNITNKMSTAMDNGEKNFESGKKRFKNNKKEKYIDNWKSRLFLHRNNGEKAITLADVFIMPEYREHGENGFLRERVLSPKAIDVIFTHKVIKNESRYSIEEKEECSLDKRIRNFMNYNRSSSMLIAGSPGIGKTSIISWMANEFDNNNDMIVLRFRDWEVEELENRLLKTICITLQCGKKELENKILILDGFDEIKAVNSRESLLNGLFNDVLDLDDLKIIITSRTDYIKLQGFDFVFELQPFGIAEIKRFYQLVKGIELEDDKLAHNNLDVLGIPVILYMAIMSDIDFTRETSKPQLYNYIFMEKGGIFDRFTYNGIGYDKGSHVLRDANNVKLYLKFLREISFLMFENNNLLLSPKEYQVPKLNQENDCISVLDFPIKQLTECVGNSIEFIHKSIYEYFVSEYIYYMIEEAANFSEKEKLAGILGDLFKKNILSLEILEFLKFRVRNSQLNDKVSLMKESFQLMSQSGMTYYTGKCYKNAITCEMNIFTNMLEFLHLWENISIKIDDSICELLKINRKAGLNLKNVNIKNRDLNGVYLAYADLSSAELSCSSFKGANLEGVKVEGTKLSNIDLRDSNLSEINFENATIKNVFLENVKLCNTIFSETDINYLKKYYEIQNDRITTSKLHEVLHSIRVKNNIINLDEGKNVLCQDDINMIIELLNKENLGK